jgi:hypothetical protein
VHAPEGHETHLWTGASGIVVARGVDTASIVRATQAGATARKLAGVAVEVERMSVAPTTYVIVDSVDGAVVEGEPLDYVAATRAAGGDRIVPAHVGVAA